MKQNLMVQFLEDDVILQQGSMKREMYKIISGKAAVYLNYGMQDEYLIGILSEQRCFGEMALLCAKPSTYTVVALSDGLLLRITEDSFDNFIKHNTYNVISIMRNLANTIDTLSMNLNMLNEDMAAISSGKNDEKNMTNITQRVRQYAAMDAINRALFSDMV